MTIPFQLQRLGMLMEPEPGNPQEVEGVLNPGVARGPDGHLYLFPRLVAKCNYSRIGIARVKFNDTGDPWANGRKRRVGHHVTLKRFHKRNARILATTTAMGRPLVISFRLERNAQPLNSAWIAGLVEFNAGDTDPGKIPLGHDPWK